MTRTPHSTTAMVSHTPAHNPPPENTPLNTPLPLQTHAPPTHPRRLPPHLTLPKLAPITLTLAAPVVASLPTLQLDPVPTSYELASVVDPLRSPTLITTIKLPSTPPATLHTTVVSDTHSVPSAPVLPIRARPLYLLTPHPSNDVNN